MAMIKNPYRSTLNASQLLAASIPTTVAGQFIELGRYTLPAGVALSLGHGIQTGQADSVGRMYADFKDDSTPAVDVDGMIRLDLHNPQDRVVSTLFEGRTESLRNATLTDRRTYIPMPEQPVTVGQDWSIVLKLMADTSGLDIDAAVTTILFDATFYDVE